MDTGLLIARLVFGAMMSAHGAQKLFGWFGGYGLKGTAGFMESIGFKPGSLFAFLAASGELVSGLLIAAGLLGPIGPALMVLVMIVAAYSVHWQYGLFATKNGIELALLYAVAGIGFALTGFGRISLDAALGISSSWTPGFEWTALVLGVVGAILSLATRRVSAPQPAH